MREKWTTVGRERKMDENCGGERETDRQTERKKRKG